MIEHLSVFGGGSADEKLVSPVEGRKLAAFLDAVSRWTVYITLLLLPLQYAPGLLDNIELPKQTLLIVAAIVATVAWLGKMLVTRTFEIRRSVMHLFIGVYAAVYVLSAWFSKARYISLVGDFGQEKAGLVTLACLILLYFVTVNVLRDAKDVKRAIQWMLLGGLLALVQSYLQAFGLKLLPGVINQTSAFSTIGTTNSLGLYSAMILALVMGIFLMPDEHDRWSLARKILMGALGVLAVIYIAVLQFWVLWVVVAAASIVLVVFGMIKTDRSLRITMLALPMTAVVIAGLFIAIRFPISLGLPSEVMPSLQASWNISREALTRAPVFGSGPGTFLYDYTQFRSVDLNATNFWNVPFDRSSSRLLTMLATTGILGFAAFTLMALYLLVRTKIKLWRGHEEWLTTLAVFAGWSALLVGKALYSSNVTLESAFWMLTAMLVVLEWRSWSESRFDRSPRAALVLTFLFIITLIFSVTGLYLQGQRLAAERYYTLGITVDPTKPENLAGAVQHLVRATQLNPRNDLYFRALSQALGAQTGLEIQKAGGKPDTDAIQRMTTLAANTVNAGKRATDLNPANVQNWSSLATLYRDLGPSVSGAVEAAESSFLKAAELDPNSPVYPTELGKIYLNMSDQARSLIVKDMKEEDRAGAQAKVDEQIKKAFDRFNKAVALKSDYAPAHYWIAGVLERQGKTVEAVAKLESVRNYNPNDLGVGFQLAILYYQNDQKDKAIVELERIVGLSPQYANARWYLASMYEEKGEMDKAIAQIVEVQKLNPENPDIQKRLDELNAKKSGGTATSESGLPAPVDGTTKP